MALSLLKSRQHSKAVEDEGILPLLAQLERGETLTFNLPDECYEICLLPGQQLHVRLLRNGQPHPLRPAYPCQSQGYSWQSVAAMRIAALVAGRPLSEIRCGHIISSGAPLQSPVNPGFIWYQFCDEAATMRVADGDA